MKSQYSSKPLLNRRPQAGPPQHQPPQSSCKLIFFSVAILFLLFKIFLLPYSHSYPPIRLPEGCDLSRGEWVPDPDAPYYTNRTCFTIQEHQNCMKYGRPDLDFLKWKWKPDGCELPRFDPVWFFDIVRGKSLVFIGDSLARNQMQSLMCLLSSVERPRDLSDGKDDNFKRMFYPRHRFTIAIYWSAFLVRAYLADADGPNHTGLWNLYLDEVDEKWASQLRRYDYVVISDGNWFTRPSLFFEKNKLVGCHYCHLPNVTDLTLHYSHRTAFRTALHAIANTEGFKGKIIVRTISPSHFVGGEWNSGGNCKLRRPYKTNETELGWLDREFYQQQMEEFRAAEAAAKAKEKGVRMKLLDTTQAMLMRPDGHPSKYGHSRRESVAMPNDCVHWCLPGPIDFWNQLLFLMVGEE